MTWQQRVEAVALEGFTERQAAFLVTVMLHAGVCVPRQYCAFANISYGRVVCEFFDSLTARGIASVRACGSPRSRLFHVHHRRLYAAIGEPHNRHRKPVTLARAIERVMLLDAVLADRETTWLATEQDKVAYFTLTHRIPRQALPSMTFRGEDSETVRYFPDKVPIGIHPDGRTHTFIALLVQSVPIDFRGFLERHAELLRSLPAWTVRLVVPAHKARAIPRYETAFREQLASPLRPSVVDEFRWYVHARRQRPPDADERFDEAVVAFGAPRFQALYRAWLERGDPVLDATQSATLADAIARQTGGLECHVLPHQYTHLLPLVGTA